MALVHFVMVLSTASMDDSGFTWVFNRLSGRPATVFMILAGIGISLRFTKVTDEKFETKKMRGLWLRGWFFLAIGFLNLALWPGDILRVYGVAYLIASYIALKSKRVLISGAFAILVVFLVMFFAIDFGTNWNFETLEYANLWTFTGGSLNLFYNGFRAVLPWLGVMLFGIWTGRFDLRSAKVRRTFFVCGIAALAFAELVSYGLIQSITPSLTATEVEDVVGIFGTDSLPPMPLFLLSSGGTAIALVMLCIHLGEVLPRALSNWFASAGRMAFTWYIAHIVVVVAAGVATGFRGDVSQPVAWLAAGLFYAAMCVMSVWYLRFQKSGPLEWGMRRLVG
jgi:uncharacterized membrane protein YeiB